MPKIYTRAMKIQVSAGREQRVLGLFRAHDKITGLSHHLVACKPHQGKHCAYEGRYCVATIFQPPMNYACTPCRLILCASDEVPVHSLLYTSCTASAAMWYMSSFASNKQDFKKCHALHLEDPG